MYGSRNFPPFHMTPGGYGPTRQELITAINQLRNENQRLRVALKQQHAKLDELAFLRNEKQQLLTQKSNLLAERDKMRERNIRLLDEQAELDQDVERLHVENTRLRERCDQLEAEQPAYEAHTPPPQPEANPSNDLQERVLRLSADIDNLRRRHGEELATTRREAKAELVREFVETLDVMEQALAAAPNPDSAWYQGSLGIKRKMESVLHSVGVESYGAVGERFNPHLHEAVGMKQVAGVPDGEIVVVVQAGYRFAEQSGAGALIRPARVLVSG